MRDLFFTTKENQSQGTHKLSDTRFVEFQSKTIPSESSVLNIEWFIQYQREDARFQLVRRTTADSQVLQICVHKLNEVFKMQPQFIFVFSGSALRKNKHVSASDNAGIENPTK